MKRFSSSKPGFDPPDSYGDKVPGRNASGFRCNLSETKMPRDSILTKRRSVLDWKMLRPERIMAMVAEADIPEADRRHLVDNIEQEFRGLHEGNVIRYRLRPEGLADIRRA